MFKIMLRTCLAIGLLEASGCSAPAIDAEGLGSLDDIETAVVASGEYTYQGQPLMKGDSLVFSNLPMDSEQIVAFMRLYQLYWQTGPIGSDACQSMFDEYRTAADILETVSVWGGAVGITVVQHHDGVPGEAVDHLTSGDYLLSGIDLEASFQFFLLTFDSNPLRTLADGFDLASCRASRSPFSEEVIRDAMAQRRIWFGQEGTLYVTQTLGRTHLEFEEVTLKQATGSNDPLNGWSLMNTEDENSASSDAPDPSYAVIHSASFPATPLEFVTDMGAPQRR